MWRKLPLERISPIFQGCTRFSKKTLARSMCSKPTSEVPYHTSLQDPEAVAPKSVPSHADAVIIGGGSLGCNTLYHLTKLGMTNVVLLEKDQLTAGTTWHTAGLVWNLRPSDIEIELLCYTRHLLGDVLEQETGINPGWINNGGLFIANNKERLDEYQRLATIGKVSGIESYVLTPKQTKELYPLMNVDDMYGSLYSPSDGTIDPAGFCTALSRAATKAGAKVLTNCPVQDIKVEEDNMGVRRVQAVETNQGTIKTPIVINCGGVWSTKLSSKIGVSNPLIGMKHAYVVSERIEGIQKMPNVRDHDASVYLKLQGDGLSIGGYEHNPIFWEDVQDDFAFSLFELDWDVFSVHIEGAINRVPVIENTGIKSTVCGPESFTPDHKPLMGESPEVRGYYLGCGFNSSGMMFGGGCGKELAHWVYHGRPELDMYGFDIRRFARFLTNNSKWIKERSHEAYAKNYSMVFPHDEPLAARGMRKDALHEELEAAGCIFQERLGWERPGWFSPKGPAPLREYDYYGSYGLDRHTNYEYEDRLTDDYTFEFPPHHDIIGNECLATRNNAAAFNMSYFGKFYLVGPDSQKAADWIFTNDMTKEEGSTSYTCMLNRAGGVESDLTVSPIHSGTGGPLEPRFDGRGFYIAAGGGNSEHSLTHINTAIQDQKFDCRVLDHSADMCMLSVQGPKSRDILQALTSTDLSNENFPFSTHQVITLAGHKLRALRLTFVGEMGWELHMPNEVAVPVYKAVMQEGAKYGIVNAGYRAIESLSIEKGYRHWHADLRTTDTPLEAALAFTCKLKKDTPFLGREALEKQKAEGIRKRIACFTVDSDMPVLGLETIYRNGEIVGFIRRGDYGFHIQKNIGYGYIKRSDGGKVTNAFIKEGEYTIEGMGVMYPAQVHIKSPFDPENRRIQGNYLESAAPQEKLKQNPRSTEI